MNSLTHITHTFKPVFNSQSKILILGSLPSVKSRENGFYYGHPQNRFWKVVAHILGKNVPQTIEEKKELLLTNKIAIWDVIASCDIVGSSDSSIKNAVVNDFSGVLSNSQITSIYTNGNKAYELYNRYALEKTGIEAVKLPSTSPANAAYNFERLCEAWREVLEQNDTRGKYISKKEFDTVLQLAQKDYIKKLYKKVIGELNDIDRYLVNHGEENLENVYATLNDYRKELVYPIVIPDDIFIKQWENELFETNLFCTEQKVYSTKKNELVRSKSEVLIADMNLKRARLI